MSRETKNSGENNVDFSMEISRLDSFANWNISFINKYELALFGFYYIGPGDQVKCNFCGVVIGRWERGDDVLRDHQRWSPHCDFIRRNATNNVPIDSKVLDQLLPAVSGIDVCGKYDTVSEGVIEKIPDEDLAMYAEFFGTKKEKETTEESKQGFEIRPNWAKLCEICHDQIKGILLLPCDHVATCEKCSYNLKECPICCQEIEHIIKVYYV